MAELNLWLDRYDDIYSDFDTRQFSKRRISEDFLSELRTVRKYRKERSVDLVLFLPKEKRNENSEHVIISRLKNFFSEQFYESQNKFRKKFNQGIGLLIAGLLIMTINSYVNFKAGDSFFLSLLKILMEPSGWFLLWLGFDCLFYDVKDLRKEREFFKELASINIHFRSS